MVTCGVCPSSQCLPRNAIPNTNSVKNDSSSSSNSGLIGGVVGGLLGGGLVLGSIGYLFIRRRNKKKTNIPLPYTTTTTRRQPVVSGVIPVAFVPPSIRTSIRTESYYSEAETPRSRIASFATFAQNSNENPFNDRPISNATSFMTTSTESRRNSLESIQQRTATVHATQVLRAKPQIMRVNTVRVQDGLTRNGSLKKTIQPESLSPDNPFDDKHVVRQSLNNSSTESMAKSTTTSADGEITIFFQ